MVQTERAVVKAIGLEASPIIGTLLINEEPINDIMWLVITQLDQLLTKNFFILAAIISLYVKYNSQ